MTPRTMGDQSNLKSWNGIGRLFNDPKYSDVTIKIYHLKFYGHRNVICSQSKYFDTALQEGSQQFLEAKTKIIEFKEGSGAAYWRVFEYLYTGDYSGKISNVDLSEDPILLVDVRVYMLADMFMIQDLKILSENKLEKKLMACRLDNSFTDCVQEVYENTQRSDYKIRHMVARCANRLANIWSSNCSYSYQKKTDATTVSELGGIRKLLTNFGEFADDYFLSTMDLKAGPNGLYTFTDERMRDNYQMWE